MRVAPENAVHGGETIEDSQHDPTKGGPLKNRSCTDVICSLLLVVFALAFVLIGFWSFVMGDPRILIYPTDYQGNVCGVGSMSGKPYLFYFDLLACARIVQTIVNLGCPTPSICISQCPTIRFTFATNSIQDFICKYNVNVTNGNTQSAFALVTQEKCAAYYVPSTSVAGRCIPTFISDAITSGLFDKNNQTIIASQLENGFKALSQLLNVQLIVQNVVQDLARSWYIILFVQMTSKVYTRDGNLSLSNTIFDGDDVERLIIFFLGLAILLSFVIIVLMRWIAGPVVLLCILLFLAFFSFAVYYCFTKYVELKNVQQNSTFYWSTDLTYYTSLYQTWLALGIIAASFLLISLLIALVLRTRILIALALIKESSRAVSNMVFTLVWPIVPLILQILVSAYWLATAICLAATNKSPNYQQSQNSTGILQSIPCDPTANTTAGSFCSFVKYGGQGFVILLELFQVFVWLWLLNFIIGLGQVTLAGAFGSYYWAFDKRKDVPIFPVTSSLKRCLRYHMGSVAFGSLILAICQMIRLGLEFLDRRLNGAQNCFAKFLIKCLKCCFWCLEKFIKYINRNAYIMIAISGRNFCSSAFHAFSLILRNIIRAAVLDQVTDFLIFLCKLFIVGGLGVLSFFLFSGQLQNAAPSSQFSQFLQSFTPQLNYYLIPVVLIIVCTFVIASLFFSVYCMAVDTLFLCFLEDLERNDGSADKPYFMSKELLKILGKKNDNYKDIEAKVK